MRSMVSKACKQQSCTPLTQTPLELPSIKKNVCKNSISFLTQNNDETLFALDCCKEWNRKINQWTNPNTLQNYFGDYLVTE